MNSRQIGDKVKVDYFGKWRLGVVERIGRTRLLVRVTFPSTGNSRARWFKADACREREMLRTAPQEQPVTVEVVGTLGRFADLEGDAEQWTKTYSDTAQGQGWGLYEVGGGLFEIEADDAVGMFAGDEEAVAFVERQAARGRPGAVEALRIAWESQKARARSDHAQSISDHAMGHAAFEAGWRDGRAAGATLCASVVVSEHPSWNDDTVNAFLSGEEDGARGDRFRLDLACPWCPAVRS